MKTVITETRKNTGLSTLEVEFTPESDLGTMSVSLKNGKLIFSTNGDVIFSKAEMNELISQLNAMMAELA